jgi:pimeloyl-ACP methyl ester carboxylesterase
LAAAAPCRPRSPCYYTLHFNGEAALAILGAELAAAQAPAPAPPTPLPRVAALRSHPLPGGDASEDDCDAGEGAAAGCQPAAAGAADAAPGRTVKRKRILIGHSMGGAAAAEAVIAAPESVAALVLVAPAVVALWLGPPQEAAADPFASGLAVVEELVSAEDGLGEAPEGSSTRSSSSTSNGGSPSLSRSNSGGSASRGGARRARRAALAAAAVAKAALLAALRALLAALSPLLVLLLRRLVRSRRFWERGLASAWHNSQRVSREYVDAYR